MQGFQPLITVCTILAGELLSNAATCQHTWSFKKADNVSDRSFDTYDNRFLSSGAVCFLISQFLIRSTAIKSKKKTSTTKLYNKIHSQFFFSFLYLQHVPFRKLNVPIYSIPLFQAMTSRCTTKSSIQHALVSLETNKGSRVLKLNSLVYFC